MTKLNIKYHAGHDPETLGLTDKQQAEQEEWFAVSWKVMDVGGILSTEEGAYEKTKTGLIAVNKNEPLH